jgi:hypothetical protein
VYVFVLPSSKPRRVAFAVISFFVQRALDKDAVLLSFGA